MKAAWAIPLLAMTGAVSAQTVTPGQWDIAVTITGIEMQGGPPGIADMMRGKTTRISQCITAEQAARGPQDLLKQQKECRFTRYVMKGGRFDSEMQCSASGTRMTATTTGTFKPTQFTANARAVMTGPMTMTTSSSSTGRRVGPCKG